MNINAREFAKTLAPLKPGLSAKESIEQSDSYIFHDGKVITFNDDVMAVMDSPIDAEGVVNAKALDDVLKKIKDADITVDFVDDQMTLTNKKMKVGLNFDSDILSPISAIPNRKNTTDLPENFPHLANLACQTTSKDISSPITMCVNLSGNMIQSLDNFRITQCSLPEVDFGDSSLVLARSLLPTLKDNPNKFKNGKKWMYFYGESGCIYCIRKYISEYPDLDVFFDDSDEITEVPLPDDFLDVLGRADAFSKNNDGDDAIRVELKKNKMRVSSQNAFGWVTETVKLKYSGDEFSFSSGPNFLKSISKFLGSDGKVFIVKESWVLRISSPDMGVEHLVKLD